MIAAHIHSRVLVGNMDIEDVEEYEHCIVLLSLESQQRQLTI